MKKYFFLIMLLSVHHVFGYQLAKTVLSDTVLASQFAKKGRMFANKAQFDSSNYYYQKSNTIYKKLLDQGANPVLWRHYLNGLKSIGVNFDRKGDYQPALEQLQMTFALAKEQFGEEDLQVWHIYNDIGIVYHHKGDYATALEIIEAVLQKRLALLGSENPHVASSYSHLAMIYSALGNHWQSLEYSKKANGIFYKLFGENHIQVACTYYNIGAMYVKCGCYDLALEYLQKSLTIDLKLSGENSPEVATTYSRLGEVYAALGDHEEALEYYGKALRISLQAYGESHPQIASLYNDLGTVYERAQNYTAALDNFLKALAIKEKILGYQHPKTAHTVGNIGVMYRHLGEYTQALSYHERALAIHLQSLPEHHPFAGHTYRNIGIVYHLMGQDTLALEHYQKALSIFKNTTGEKHPLVADIYQYFGELYQEQGNYPQALNYYQKALIAVTPDFTDSSWQINPSLASMPLTNQSVGLLKAKAGALWKFFRSRPMEFTALHSAFDTYQLLAALMDKLLQCHHGEASKLFLAEKMVPAFEQAIMVSHELYRRTGDELYAESAFDFAERNKAAVLSLALSEARAQKFAGIPDSLIEQERRLNTQWTHANIQLLKLQQLQLEADANMAKTIAELEDQLFSLDQQRLQLSKQIEQSYPNYYALKYQPAGKILKDLQVNLGPSSLLVEYFIGQDSLYIFTVSHKNLEIFSLPKGPDFVANIERCLQAIKKMEMAEMADASHKIFLQLIKPLEAALIGIDHLIVIPDGILYKLPFEALLTRKVDPSEEWTHYPYLLKHYEMAYHYSARLYHLLHNRDEETIHPKTFLGFAPVFKHEQENQLLAENLSNLKYTTFQEAMRSVTVDGKQLNALEYSEEEVNKIMSNFDRQGRLARAFFHEQATEAKFKETCGQYDIVHISTHGLVNEKQPRLSSIIFTQTKDTLSGEDGILYAGETYNLNLQAKLVVLSSCESGIGPISHGEGMMSLARGFFYSGAADLMLSLWKISDRHTSRLMVDFYQQVLEGKTFSDALRKAKLNMIKNAATCWPRMWAGFVLFGE